MAVSDSSGGILSGKYVRQVTIATSGPQGAQGPTGPQGPMGPGGVVADDIASLVSYTHLQSATSDMWTIVHNLNFFPNVTAFDSAGTQVEGNVIHTNETTLNIVFSSPISGKAHLS